MNPEQPPPACMCMPSGWMSPQAMSAPQGAGRREHAERDRVDAVDREGAVLVRELHDLGAGGLDGPEVAGVLEVDGGEGVVELGLEIAEVDHAGLAVPLVEADLDAVGHRVRAGRACGSPISRIGLMCAGTRTLSRPVMRRAMRNERPATSPQS